MDQTDGDGMFKNETSNLGGYTPEEWAAVEAQEAAQMQRLDAKFARIETAIDALLGKHSDRTALERELYAARAALKRLYELAEAYAAKAENLRRGGSYNLQRLYLDVAKAVREALKGDQADGE